MEKAKELFNSQYYGQKILRVSKDAIAIQPNNAAFWNMCYDSSWIGLRAISSITDDEAIDVARFSHQMKTDDFKVKRDNDIIHVENTDKVGITHHISIYKDYGTVNSNVHFSETNTQKFVTYKANIGEINMSAERPIPYLAIADYLRSKGFLIQFSHWDNIKSTFTTYSNKKILELGWAKII